MCPVNTVEISTQTTNCDVTEVSIDIQKSSLGCQTEKYVVSESVQTALKIPPSTDIFKFFPLVSTDNNLSAEHNLENSSLGCQIEKVVTESVQTSLNIPPSTDIFKFFPPISKDCVSTEPNLQVVCENNGTKHIHTGERKVPAQVSGRSLPNILRSAVSKVLDQ